MHDFLVRIIICPSCGSGSIKKVRKNWTGNFKGQSYTVPSVEFFECTNCGEKIYDRQAMRKIESFSPAFAKPHAEREVQVLNNN